MINHIFKFATKHWPIIILLAFSLALAFLNHQTNTWVTGWDNLHPEFNPALNIKRSLSTTWQEYQSLGLLGGMAHAADLPRQLLFLLLSSLRVPPTNLRYLWTFLMLIIGPIGTYFIAKNTIFSQLGPHTRRLISFFSGLFYLLNLATIQNFYTPFETFTSFYGFLPWIIFSFINYFQTPTRKNFAFLFSTLLLGSTSFYTQTLFLVFSIVFVPLLFHHLISNKLSKKSILTFLVSLLTLLFTQAYWLFPTLYFTATSSSVTINSIQNQLATRETFARNQEFGNLREIPLLKGFWFDYVDLGDNNKFSYLMQPWLNHFDSPVIYGLGYLVFALTLLGIIYAFRKQLPYKVPFITSLLVCLFFLINQDPPIGSILTQAFRSVFTKWSVATALFLSFFFASGCLLLYSSLLKLSKKLAPFILSFSIGFLLILLNLPAFQGHLIYKNLRVNIPNEYFQLFDYLNTQDPNTRVANFPQHTPWGWEFYSWGYRGSGFLWYGIKQPILDRAFDVWSPYSENYYDEIKVAIYSQDLTQLENILEKYSVTWLLLDENIIIPANEDQTALYIEQTKKLVSQSPRIHKEKDFDQISLYRFDLSAKPSNFLDTTSKSFNPPASIQNFAPILLADSGASLLQNRSTLKLDPKNCDNFNSTSFDKKLDGNTITYSATNANSCDHFLYPEVFLGAPHNLKITHRNLEGFPLQLCVEPYPNKNCLVFKYLPESKDWITTTISLPALNPQEYGYAVHLFNYSIGQNKTHNQLSSITFEPSSEITPPPTSLLNYPAQITTSSHPQYHLYTLTANSSQNADLLILNQAYDENWQLYKDDHKYLPSPIKYLLHFFQEPIQKDTHTPAYAWANAWTLPHGQNSYTIIYTPQGLQTLGFALLTLLPILYLLHKKTD